MSFEIYGLKNYDDNFGWKKKWTCKYNPNEVLLENTGDVIIFTTPEEMETKKIDLVYSSNL